MLRPMDLWRCAIVARPATELMAHGIDPAALTWLPDMPAGCFRADPFGLWRDNLLHVFTEAFDYGTRRGHIDLLVYDAGLTLLDCRTVLREPWHLSYPFVFEAEGEVWMLPEAYRSGSLTLYRARRFPTGWERVCRIDLDGPAIDATPVFHHGRWWLFYAPAHSRTARLSHLHLAWSDRLTGPWRVHASNPVRVDLGGARPGGTVRQEAGGLILPVQDCRGTYGAGLRELSIGTLSETEFEAHTGASLSAPRWMAPFADGLHTLSVAGAVTLIDVKRMDRTLRARAARLQGIIKQKIFSSTFHPRDVAQQNSRQT